MTGIRVFTVTLTVVMFVAIGVSIASGSITEEGRLLLDTAWGRMSLLDIYVGAALVAIALSIRGLRRVGFFAIGAAVIVSSYPILGHTTDGSVWVATPATMIHVGAMSVWVGGLGAVLIVGLGGRQT